MYSLLHSRSVQRHLFVLIVGLLSLPISISSQEPTSPPQVGSRKIVSDDFTNNRQQSNETARPNAQGGILSNTAPRPKSRRTYRLASTTSKAKPSREEGTKAAQLGVTIWRLRPVRASETGARMLLREKGKSLEWIPERVESDTIFREGDQLRLSIESPRAGYLYVVDQDLLSDGTTGPAMLIYPWADMLGSDNKMRPGKLVDIPAQEEEPSYFTARRSTPNQVGEVLTVIITTSPLNLPISNEPIRISAADLEKWVNLWGGPSERFEMEGGAGEVWTKQEQQASARKGTRQLTREDPAPQTIYRIFASDNKALLVNVRLRYGK